VLGAMVLGARVPRCEVPKASLLLKSHPGTDAPGT